MIRSITLTALFFSLVALVHADISVEQTSISVQKTGEVINNDLSENEAIYLFNFADLNPVDTNAMVSYSLDNIEFQSHLNGLQLKITTVPGIHSFQFSVTSNIVGFGYNSTTADSLEIAAKTEASYRITPIQIIQILEPIYTIKVDPNMQMQVCKPVIYLYPENTTVVNIEVNIHGDRPFYYPAYEDNWSVTAHPNGDLEFGNESYRYLFWESDDADHLSEIVLNEGFVVEGDNAISFLESHLNTFGFTAAERADFITYWGPKLAANNQNLVRFEWNQACDKFADLNISPQPDHIYRFYIFMSALEADYEIHPQIIPTMNRDGFTVLEWGGQVSNFQPNKAL